MQAFEKKKIKRRNDRVDKIRDTHVDTSTPARRKKCADTGHTSRLLASTGGCIRKKEPSPARRASSKLLDIYNSEDREEKASEFIESATRASVEAEIKCLSLVISDKGFDLKLSLFMCETLSALGYNHELAKVMYKLLDIKSSCKYSIYRIRLLRCLQAFNGKRFLPIGAQILETIENAQTSVNRSSEKRPSMDSLKVSSDNISEEFFAFVLGKCLKLLFKHLDVFSNSIAFPEVVFFILERLRTFKRNEEIKKFIGRVKSHAKYIEAERKKLDSTLSMKAVSIFEKTLRRMSTET